MSSSQPLDRRTALSCDRALIGLDPRQEMELVSLLGPGMKLDPGLELAAAAIVCAELTIDEPLPSALSERIFAAAFAPASGQPISAGGTVMMPVRSPNSEVRTKVLPSTPSSPPTPRTLRDLPTSEPRPDNVVSISTARPKRNWVPWLAAAACFGLAVGSVLYSVGQKPGGVATSSPSAPTTSVAEVKLSAADAKAKLLAEAKDVVRTSWTPTEDAAAKGASGEIVWSNERQEGYMTFRAVQPNDPKLTQYQLWIFDAERDERYPVDGGVFDVGPGGEVVVPITARVKVNKPTLFAVTVEQPGGVVVSKRERIIVTAKVTG